MNDSRFLINVDSVSTIASVSECTWTLSVIEALRNALYKFKTYLLEYLHSVYCTVFLYISDRICSFLHSAPTVAQCIVIGFVCLWVGECMWVGLSP